MPSHPSAERVDACQTMRCPLPRFMPRIYLQPLRVQDLLLLSVLEVGMVQYSHTLLIEHEWRGQGHRERRRRSGRWRRWRLEGFPKHSDGAATKTRHLRQGARSPGAPTPTATPAAAPSEGATPGPPARPAAGGASRVRGDDGGVRDVAAPEGGGCPPVHSGPGHDAGVPPAATTSTTPGHQGLSDRGMRGV